MGSFEREVEIDVYIDRIVPIPIISINDPPDPPDYNTIVVDVDKIEPVPVVTKR